MKLSILKIIGITAVLIAFLISVVFAILAIKLAFFS